MRTRSLAVAGKPLFYIGWLLLLAAPATAQTTGSYSPPTEFMDLFFDFTGSNAFGQWLLEHSRQAQVFAEMAGVFGVVVQYPGASGRL